MCHETSKSPPRHLQPGSPWRANGNAYFYLFLACLRSWAIAVTRRDPQPTEWGHGSNLHPHGHCWVLNSLSHNGNSRNAYLSLCFYAFNFPQSQIYGVEVTALRGAVRVAAEWKWRDAFLFELQFSLVAISSACPPSTAPRMDKMVSYCLWELPRNAKFIMVHLCKTLRKQQWARPSLLAGSPGVF